ncbi:MAG: hypothetical protein O3A13_16120 [Proteobacteria bacterium]|nr:hypothetical protein [Pseudomonadota bacterium]MDA0995138.1 hypothetical protein [Pseudomonadota bacterium]
MISDAKNNFPSNTNKIRWLHTIPGVLTLALLLFSSLSLAETVRDDFSVGSYGNNDGTANWSANWIEDDVAGTGPASGNVFITGGELSFDDQPNTNTQPGLAREANLAGASSATLNFDWRTTNGVDNSDSFIVEISADGGTNWTTLENFTGINGTSNGSRAFDITTHVAANTQVRFRVNNNYRRGNEFFIVDYVEIDYTVILSGTDLAVTQIDTPDPVNVTNPLSYSLTVTNNGPDDATGVTVVDVLPADVYDVSAYGTELVLV